jgi:hypothetical protein
MARTPLSTHVMPAMADDLTSDPVTGNRLPGDNVEAVDELVTRGVRFERYEGLEQGEKGIHRGGARS